MDQLTDAGVGGSVERHPSVACPIARQYRPCACIVKHKTGQIALFSLDSFNSFLTDRGVGIGLIHAFIWAKGDEIVAQIDLATGYLLVQCVGHVDCALMHEKTRRW